MTDVPVALFAYNRPDILGQVLESLRASGVRSLIVFSDGPRDAADAERVAAVRRAVRSISWTEPVLVERERNLHVWESVQSGLDWTFQRHERAIVIEDDVVVAPEFYAFVTQALDAYADEERVAGVTGLRMPFGRAALRRYSHDAFMLPRFFSLGWATWRRAWGEFDLDPESLLRRIRELRVRLEMAGADVPYMVRKAFVDEELEEAWDVACMASIVLDDRLFVVPTWNMVENIGLTTGTHPKRPRWTLRLESEHRPSHDLYRFPPIEVEPHIQKSFRVFTENPLGWTPARLVPRPVRMLFRRVRGTYDIFR